MYFNIQIHTEYQFYHFFFSNWLISLSKYAQTIRYYNLKCNSDCKIYSYTYFSYTETETHYGDYYDCKIRSFAGELADTRSRKSIKKHVKSDLIYMSDTFALIDKCYNSLYMWFSCKFACVYIINKKIYKAPYCLNLDVSHKEKSPKSQNYCSDKRSVVS